MSSTTNTAINSRSMNGVITITDGTATLENGDLNCNDINSDSINTASITTGIFTCNGEFRSNLVGPYTIPVSASAEKGSLISYGNVSNSGATDFTNYGSTYNLLKQGFYFNNINSTQPLTNLAIIDNSQTYFKSQLVGCTAETPLSSTSIVNKSYVDNNFVDLVSSESIGGFKNFTNNTTFRGTLKFYDRQTPFTNNSEFFHIGGSTIFSNLSNSGIITYNTRTSTGVASNVVEISSSFTKMFKPLRLYDTLTPFQQYTESLQAGTVMSYSHSYNLGSYQFKTRGSTGATTTPLVIDNDGISVFGTTLSPIMESSSYRGTSATTDLAFGSTTTSGRILIGTVLNGSGELRLGTTLSINNINGLTTFQKIPLIQGTQTPILDNELTTKLYVDSMPVHQILNTNNTWTGTNTFNSFLPTSTLTPSSGTQLITKTYADGTFIDFTTDQTITATNKRFNGLFTTGISITPTVGGSGNRQQIYITGTELSFNPLFDSNYYRFYCRNSLSNQINPLEISYDSTVIRNSLSGQRSSFRTPNVNESALALFGTGAVDNRIQFITYTDGNLGYQNIFQNKDCGILFTSEQTIDRGAFCIAPWNSGSAGIRISVANVGIAGPLVVGGEATFNTWVNLKFRTRIYDLSGGSNYSQIYMINGNELVIGPNANGDKISFYCKDATLGQLNTFISSALGNTSNVNLTCSASLISNNLLATTSSIAGTNNLYTNLDSVNGFGIVNFGTRGNNINIKCNLNINESVYGTTQNTVVNMEGNSLRFTNNGSINGNYIFTINESGTYNTLVINKTSVDIAGDANISGDLILYDTTPSTKTISASLVNNDFTFNPNNTVSTTYKFKTNDSIGVDTTPLTISSSGTTLTNITTTNVLYTKDLRWYDVGGGSNIQQIFLSTNNLSFLPLFNNNQYSFQCKDNVPNTTTPLSINSSSTTIANNLISNSQATFNNFTPICSVASPTANNHLTRKDYIDNNFMYKINNVAESINGVKTFGNRVNLYGQTALIVGDGTITSGLAEFNGTTRFNNDVLYSQATININSTSASHNVNLFSAITSGTINIFSSLSNSLVSMFNSSTNNSTLEINAKVKFRQVKLYNQVKTITATTTLTFPLEEQIVIRPTATTYIELPLITANSLGMSFNFITNSTAYAIWFSTQGTDNIIKNGYTTGNTSTVVLGTNGITSVQMTCLELTAGVYSWSFFSSLPEKVSNPAGTIITMAVQSTPLGYLACDGGSYSFGGIYSNLYQVIGTTYGSSGVGTFKVPNFNNGSFLRGVGGNSAVIATQQQDNIKTHTHNTTFYRFEKGSSGGTNVISDLSTGNLGTTVVASATNTAGSPDETRPINYAVHYCIKY